MSTVKNKSANNFSTVKNKIMHSNNLFLALLKGLFASKSEVQELKSKVDNLGTTAQLPSNVTYFDNNNQINTDDIVNPYVTNLEFTNLKEKVGDEDISGIGQNISNSLLNISSQINNLNESTSGISDEIAEINTTIGNVLIPRGYYNDKDLDSLFTPGVYVCVNCSHAPTTSWGTVIVFKGGTGSFVQIFCSENAVYYIRHYYISATSKWSDWDNLVKKSDLITMSTFTDQWVPGFLIKGYGFCIQIPRNSKNQILTITIIEIYVDNVWKTPTSFQAIQRPNCWNVVCNEAGLGLAYGNVYLAKINGKIE